MVTAGVFLVGRRVSEVASLASNLWGSLARSEILMGDILGGKIGAQLRMPFLKVKAA